MQKRDRVRELEWTPPPITAEMLRDKGACSWKTFQQLFPKGSPRTLSGAIRAAKRVANQFDWDWAVNKLLSRSARRVYYAATNAAHDAYLEARRDEWRSFGNGYSMELQLRLDQLRGIYNEVKAEAFARAYFSDANR